MFKQREMEIFTTLIVIKMKEANFFAGQGGPVILTQVNTSPSVTLDGHFLNPTSQNVNFPPLQIENEYGNIQAGLPDQESATKYIHWCADMANKQNVGVPWIMCQQKDDVPPNVVSFSLQFQPALIQLINDSVVQLDQQLFNVYCFQSSDQHLQWILLP